VGVGLHGSLRASAAVTRHTARRARASGSKDDAIETRLVRPSRASDGGRRLRVGERSQPELRPTFAQLVRQLEHITPLALEEEEQQRMNNPLHMLGRGMFGLVRPMSAR
jgi:hypothetical protein